jgi:hypothetical protein
MDMLDPFLIWSFGLLLIEVGKGLYFYDFDFSQIGTYVAILYEDGAKATSQNFFIMENLGGGSSDVIGGTFRGPSVINT